MEKRPIGLVVEDDEATREMLGWVLEAQGFEVVLAPDGVQGMRYLEDGPRPDLILLDLMMPLMDGWAFRRTLLKHPQWRTIPVVVISAATGAEDSPALRGVADFLRKPVSPGDLAATASRFC